MDEFFTACRQHNVICTPINSMRRVSMDRHLRERGCFAPLDQPGVGTLTLPGPPSRFSAARSTPRSSAPRLGQHTEEILQQRLGMNPDEIAALRSRAVI
jgi:crotonobetainyl-CoA:carnitine CoA-transferase CaiB-like acyl-CoA transferase